MLNNTVLPKVSQLVVQGRYGLSGGFKLQHSFGGNDVAAAKSVESFVNGLLRNEQMFSGLVLSEPMRYKVFEGLRLSAVQDMEINCRATQLDDLDALMRNAAGSHLQSLKLHDMPDGELSLTRHQPVIGTSPSCPTLATLSIEQNWLDGHLNIP